ncbi:hypothetical protein J6590_025052 [Homalodisca vitripennis]|nr:hypothetical protein J6590_025052 [Homalodisca vitripennis]
MAVTAVDTLVLSFYCGAFRTLYQHITAAAIVFSVSDIWCRNVGSAPVVLAVGNTARVPRNLDIAAACNHPFPSPPTAITLSAGS